MQSKATTVAAYLAELPPDRRAAISAVRDVILKNLDKDYAERMSYGMIGYCVPHSIFPAGYHCDPKMPLPFAALASQKNHMAVYLMGLYCGCDGGPPTKDVQWFHEAWAKTGKKLDMGKSCIRFKKLEDLPLDVIGEAIRRVPAKKYIEFYEKAILSNNQAAAARSAARKAGGTPARKAGPSKKKVTESTKKTVQKSTTRKSARR